MLRNILLICGILSSLLYAAMTIFIAMQRDSYNFASQTNIQFKMKERV